MDEQFNYPHEVHIHGDVHIHYYKENPTHEHKRVHAQRKENQLHVHRNEHVPNSTQNTRGIDKRLKDSYKEIMLKSMSFKQDLYFITWTYAKKVWGRHYDEVEKDIGQIRKRIIHLFYQNFKDWKDNRPTKDFPRMWFVIEPHADGQYHIHLIMEPVDPDLLARGLHNQRFQLIWDRIVRQKICKRDTKDQQVITNKMLEKHPEYKYHHHSQKTFSQPNRYDHWLIARFICEYITHNNKRNGELWGLNRLTNSPNNINSKVMEREEEVINKIDYLNKDKNFKKHHLKHQAPSHLCFKYSDLSNNDNEP